jgi:peptidoglycan/xylan/chitin deacetylase (PgdA/CDA1 family)
MSHYHVEKPERGWVRWHLVLMLAVLLVALLGLPAYTTVSVTIDGRRCSIERGSTVDDILELGLTAQGPGDVLGMNGHVVAEGRGAPPTVSRYGAALSGSDQIHSGDVVTSRRGLDVVERQIPTASPIPISIEYRGDGPLERVASAGSQGVSLLGVGSISGLVTPLGVAESGQPMVVERTYPAVGDRVVALTFDDGPWPGQTERILEILAAEGVHATFFALGVKAAAHPDLTARIAEEGHQVESHGYSHRYLTTSDKALARREARKSKYQIARATGVYPTWFRAPGGKLSDTARTEVTSAGMRVVRWDVDPQDWRQDSAWRLARETIGAVKPGSVVLLHDGGGDRTATIDALTTIIRKLKKQGYTFVTLDEMGPSAPN